MARPATPPSPYKVDHHSSNKRLATLLCTLVRYQDYTRRPCSSPGHSTSPTLDGRSHNPAICTLWLSCCPAHHPPRAQPQPCLAQFACYLLYRYRTYLFNRRPPARSCPIRPKPKPKPKPMPRTDLSRARSARHVTVHREPIVPRSRSLANAD